jgi:hypothetical protein
MEERELVRVACWSCGNVKVRSDAVTIRNCTDADDWSYWFVCPKCHRRSAASTSRRLAVDAISAGASLHAWSLPAELGERHEGPPFTFVDMLELRLRLIEPDWVDELQ